MSHPNGNMGSPHLSSTDDLSLYLLLLSASLWHIPYPSLLHPPPLGSIYTSLCVSSAQQISISLLLHVFLIFSCCQPLLHLPSTSITEPISLPSLHRCWSPLPLDLAALSLPASFLLTRATPRQAAHLFIFKILLELQAFCLQSVFYMGS